MPGVLAVPPTYVADSKRHRGIDREPRKGGDSAKDQARRPLGASS